MKFSLRVSYNSIADYSIIEYVNHNTTDLKKQLGFASIEGDKGQIIIISKNPINTNLDKATLSLVKHTIGKK
jgi:hypothetical protein